MATTTPNYHLRKPTNADQVNVATDISGNMDLLDAHTHSGTYERVFNVTGLDPTGAVSASVLIQPQLDAAHAAGGGRVVINDPGTYLLGLRYMTGYTDIMAGIWLYSDVHLWCAPGVKFKLPSGITLLPGVTVANQRAHGITVMDPYAVAGVHRVKTNVKLTNVELDCNAAGQSAVTMYAGIFLGSVDGAWLTDCKVYDLYGTASGPPGETMCFDIRSSRNVHHRGCLANGTALAENSSGFSANYSQDVTYDDCTSHDLENGMGFTVWQCAGVSYDGCHAFTCIEAAGFNAERSEDIAYNGCVSGGRSPTTNGETDLPWFPADNTPLGSAWGWSISGCTNVSGSGNVSAYNGIGVYVHTNAGISPTLGNNGIDFAATVLGNTTDFVVDDGTLHTALNIELAVAGGDEVLHYGVAPFHTYKALNLASGYRINVDGWNSGFVYRLSATGETLLTVPGGTANVGGDTNRTDRLGDAIFKYGVRAESLATKHKSGAAVYSIADTDFAHQPIDGAIAFARDTTNGTVTAYVRSNGAWVRFDLDPDLLTTGEASMPRNALNSSGVATGNQSLRLRYFTAKKTETITQVRVNGGPTAAAATPTLVRIGIWTADLAGALITQVGATPNDTALFATANTEYTKSLSASWDKVAGQRYATGLLVVTGVAAPNVWGNLGPNTPSGRSPKVGGLVSGQADLPASVLSGSVAAGGNMPFIEMLP